jgi:hypothetical protein
MKPPVCLVPNCRRTAHGRGLCTLCYTIARRLVRKGLTTWAALESNGKCLPKTTKRTHTAKARAWFLSNNESP